jgi:hypothetical protein
MTNLSKPATTQDISLLLQQIGAQPGHFPLSSRYRNVTVTSMQDANGQTVVYLKRRFVPQADNFDVLQLYTVKEGDRLDNIAHQFIGDPEQFWQICDANNVLEPGELTEQPGDTIRITLPEGIPGNTNA